MNSTIDNVFTDRESAGVLLANKLQEYKNTNAVVVGVPHGGVCVASAIARILSLPLEIMPCTNIKDPADKRKSIGSVSPREVMMHECSYDIPQDYIAHQIALLRSAVSYKQALYYKNTSPGSLKYKTVILVDDILQSSEMITVCLREIKREKPLKIIVAVPVVSAEAARVAAAESDGIEFLRIEATLDSGDHYFSDFKKIDDSRVNILLERSRANNTKRTSGKATANPDTVSRK
jgi:putative phosphoribosyl transferase